MSRGKLRSNDSKAPPVQPLPLWLSAPLVAVLCGLLVAIVALVPSQIGDVTRWPTISTLVLTFGALLAFYSWRQHWRPLKTSQRPTLVLPLAEDQVLFLQRSAGARGHAGGVDEFQVMAFTYAIIEPAMVRQRITERYVPGRRTLAQKVTIEAHIPSLVMGYQTPDIPAEVQLDGTVTFAASDWIPVIGPHDLARFQETGLDWRGFLLPNLPWMLMMLGKRLAWWAVLVVWLVRGTPPSPWRAVTVDATGREVRAIVRADTAGAR